MGTVGKLNILEFYLLLENQLLKITKSQARIEFSQGASTPTEKCPARTNFISSKKQVEKKDSQKRKAPFREAYI